VPSAAVGGVVLGVTVGGSQPDVDAGAKGGIVPAVAAWATSTASNLVSSLRQPPPPPPPPTRGDNTGSRLSAKMT